ncbi:hypothetical protein T11_6862 [Trichinella zimbabwensis]|uniref:Uncharacterized protein n=1 Tax=Trichinella zimbabwensis TaxID=268475 RepID=A0A0V1H3D6_9BILA|nr:hypothetical protein T11_6862 [Trichinella zimbabwensis]
MKIYSSDIYYPSHYFHTFDISNLFVFLKSNPWLFCIGMWKTDLSTFDSWSFRWESTQELWFILVEEDELPFLRLRSGVNQASVGKFPFTTMTERRSRAMGRASFNARFNITDVICAPSFTCFTAADNFIKGFQDGLEDEMKILNIKVDGGLSSTVEGYYLHKQFRSMVVESGFNVDETYETSVKCPENYKIDPYVNLDWRINAALGSIKKKYSGSMFQMVAVFVDKCLDNVLKGATVGSWPAFKMPHSEFYTFDTFAYYQDCNPLLWFIMIKNVPFYFPSQCKAENKRNIFDSPVISVAERRVRFMGSSSRDAGINITDVICAPSLKCIDLADRFVEGYESKLEKKDKVLEIKIDGGFSESIQYYHVHEQLKANIMECGYRIDKTHETSYKCPENCNYESSIKMNERVIETLKSIRAKYSDSTNRTMVVFVDKCLEPALRFLIKQPLIALELYICSKIPLPCAGVYSSKQPCRNQISKLLTRWRFVGSRNEESEWKFQSMTTIEGKSRLMGETSHKARFNITDVICAPSIKCIVAAHNFIKGFERDQKEEMKILNIKVDGGLSESIEGYYLQKPFRSLAAERGYPVDEVYETSVTWSESCKVDPFQMVAVFVDKCLDNVLKGATVGSWPAFKVHVPSVGISPFILEKFEE